MRAPEKKTDYRVFEADGITVYLNREVMDRIPGRIRALRFQVQGYGYFRIVLTSNE
jgi:hypothetical protein